MRVMMGRKENKIPKIEAGAKNPRPESAEAGKS
jgi:hypothetical protein